LKTADRVETVRSILKWLKTNVEYKNELVGIGKVDFTKVEELLKRGHAECRGYTMLFVGLCRAAGIPARSVWGLIRIAPTGERPKGSWASHNWAEVYFPGSGWVPVDPQKPETLGWLPSNIIRIFMDVRQSEKTQEHLPMRNLVHMNGETIEFEVSP
jgi:transglutaminase-like putative cysteine protease